jgi:uncharacterized phage infection (PIP) family protein YhgE
VQEFWNKIKWFCISGGIGLIFGAALTFAIIQGSNNKYIDRLSANIVAGTALNTSLQQANFRLTEANTRLSSTVGDLQAGTNRLEKQIRDGNTEHQRQLEEAGNRFSLIKAGLGTISEGLGKTGTTLQGIIEGLEQIKTLIKSLP